VMDSFQPNAVVLQCGADSLTGDRLGCFNLTLKGHGKCVDFMRKYNVPLLMLGGGGYTIRNVARCWTYETSVALGVEVANELPYNDYFEYYSPDFKLHITPSNMTNQNSEEYLNKIKVKLFENLRMLPHAPGVQMQPIPEDAIGNLNEAEEADEDNANPNERVSIRANDKNIEHDAEMYDGEKEGGDLRNEQDYRHAATAATGDGDDVKQEDDGHEDKIATPIIPPTARKSRSRDISEPMDDKPEIDAD